MDTSIIQTPLYYGQFDWSQKCQNSYITYLYNTDTSVEQTLGSVPLVFVLKRFDCIWFKESKCCQGIQNTIFWSQVFCWLIDYWLVIKNGKKINWSKDKLIWENVLWAWVSWSVWIMSSWFNNITLLQCTDCIVMLKLFNLM